LQGGREALVQQLKILIAGGYRIGEQTALLA
jgi:hypothetical protein